MARIECGFPDAPNELVDAGPTIPVLVGALSTNEDEQAMPPGLNEFPCAALIDTGANHCCIDATLASALDLPTIGKEMVGGVHGVEDVNVYLAQVKVTGVNTIMQGRFTGVQLRTTGLPLVLLGRDFLSMYHLDYQGPSGSVVLRDEDSLG